MRKIYSATFFRALGHQYNRVQNLKYFEALMILNVLTFSEEEKITTYTTSISRYQKELNPIGKIKISKMRS
jgi:hypothetical protein